MMGTFIDITDKQFNNWKALEYDKLAKKWLCECQCERHTRQLISSADLRNGKTKSCGCQRKKNLIGEQFGHLIVDDYAENYHWKCHCVECNRQFIVHTYHLEHNNLPKCNHNGLHSNVDDIKGKHFGEWEVLEYSGNKYWKCRCSCGTVRNVLGKDLRNKKSRSCGHSIKSTEKIN